MGRKIEMYEELARRVESEFSQAVYPGDQNLGIREIEDFIGQKEWRKVPLELLIRKNSVLISFSPAAYHFYLPAFLCALLRHPDFQGYLEQPIVYSLIPSPILDMPNEIPEQAIPLFTTGEKSLIVEFLENHANLFPSSPYSLFDDLVEAVQFAIKFWKES